MAANSVKGYESDWQAFATWCAEQPDPLSSLPAHPDVVALYLAHMAVAAYSLATIERHLAAINKMHELHQERRPGTYPAVSATIAGIRRENLGAQNRAHPLMLDDIRMILRRMDIHSWPTGVSATRDAAVLLLGFAGAFRRSELCALKFGDLVRHPEDGLHVTIRQSKTDQTGKGLLTAIPYGMNPLTCPVCAYVRWTRVYAAVEKNARATAMKLLREQNLDQHVCREPLPELEGIHRETPLFQPLHRSGRILRPTAINAQMVMDTVQKWVTVIGYDPAPYSAHSLRAGFVSQARRAGASLEDISRQTHHRRLETVAGYDRNNPLVSNAVTKLGL